MSNMYHYTDYEATIIYLAAVKHNLTTPSAGLSRELNEYPALRFVLERHSPGSVSARWSDFRSAVRTDLTPTNGARLPQIRRIVEDLQFFTGLTMRDDLISEAA